MIFNVIKRMFSEPDWRLAIREFYEETPVYFNTFEKIEYVKLASKEGHWCADPFICRDNGHTYIFCEYYIKKINKGAIAACEYKKGEACEMKIIIQQAYHMSYPCLFKYEKDFYMIPETADNRTIELYRAKNFPYEWELIKVLKEDIRCVDTTVFDYNNKLYAIGYKLNEIKSRVCVFHLDMTKRSLELVEEFLCHNSGRPSGSIFNVNGKLIRPTQISKNKYGEGIAFMEIVSVKEPFYCENQLLELRGKDIFIKGEKRIDRVHTTNRLDNMEIIDYSHDKVNLVRPMKLIYSRLRLKATS